MCNVSSLPCLVSPLQFRVLAPLSPRPSYKPSFYRCKCPFFLHDLVLIENKRQRNRALLRSLPQKLPGKSHAGRTLFSPASRSCSVLRANRETQNLTGKMQLPNRSHLALSERSETRRDISPALPPSSCCFRSSQGSPVVLTSPWQASSTLWGLSGVRRHQMFKTTESCAANRFGIPTAHEDGLHKSCLERTGAHRKAPEKVWGRTRPEIHRLREAAKMGLGGRSKMRLLHTKPRAGDRAPRLALTYPVCLRG